MHLGSLTHPRWPSLWLVAALGGVLLLALIFAQAVRAAGEGIDLSTDTLDVNEGQSASFMVALTGDAPEGNVVVDITSDNTDVTVVPAELTFTPGNHQIPRSVIVSASEDDDAQDEGATLTVTINDGTSDDAFDEVADQQVAVNVQDNDAAGVTISEDSLALTEGTPGDYTVVLDAQPTHNVSIAISSDDAAVTVPATSLTFTPDNWNQTQTVTVTPVEDDTTLNESATLTHAITSGDSAYNALADMTVSVTVDDNEDAAVTISGYSPSLIGDSLPLTEGGDDGTYTVRLAEQPTHAVTVAIGSSDSGAVTVSPTSLTFNPEGDDDLWSAEQTVTVTAVDDADNNGESVTLTHTVSSADTNYDALADPTVMVTVTDVNAGVSISETSLELMEATPGEYTVVLQEEPTSSVIIAIRSDNAAVTVSPASLTFTTDNWNTAETVTVTPVGDATTHDESATITHVITSGDSAYNALADMTVSVTVEDDETAAVTISDADALALTEGGDEDTYMVVLGAQPTHAVTVAIGSSDSGAVTVSPTSLTFNPEGDDDLWSAEQTVTVTAVGDADNSDESVTLTHAVSSADSNYDALGDQTVTVTVTDVNAGLRLADADSLEVTEGTSATDSFMVVLQAQPTHAVTVAVTSGDDEAATVLPASLEFTTDNWNQAQEVTVTPVDDDDAMDETVTLRLAVSSNDPRYRSPADQTVMVGVTDGDKEAGIIPSATEIVVLKGESGTFTAKLQSAPSDNVDVTVATESTDVTVEGGDTTLTFTMDNWNTAQEVMVMVVEDPAGDSAVITLTANDAGGYTTSIMATVTVNFTGAAPVTPVAPETAETPAAPAPAAPAPAAPAAAAPNVVGGTSAATATEVNGQVVITRHDGGASLVINIGGFIRDDAFGQTYQVVRRADGMIVRQWVSPDSPLVYQIPWAVVNSQFTVPVGVVGAIPLDDQSGAAGQLVRRFDGGDDRIFSYDMGQWRHVPDIATFQALGLYWCDVTAADATFFERITIGPAHPATDMPARSDYPNCSTG